MINRSRLIDLPKVCEITCQGKTSIYQLIASGELRPVKLGRKTVFAESEVFEWVTQRLASRQWDKMNDTVDKAAVRLSNLRQKTLRTPPSVGYLPKRESRE